MGTGIQKKKKNHEVNSWQKSLRVQGLGVRTLGFSHCLSVCWDCSRWPAYVAVNFSFHWNTNLRLFKNCTSSGIKTKCVCVCVFGDGGLYFRHGDLDIQYMSVHWDLWNRLISQFTAHPLRSRGLQWSPVPPPSRSRPDRMCLYSTPVRLQHVARKATPTDSWSNSRQSRTSDWAAHIYKQQGKEGTGREKGGGA